MRSKISNTEWGLVIGALLMVDIIQIILDVAFQIGVIVNRFIDVVVGGALAFYLHIRGEKLSDPKRIIALAATFLGEEVPDVDALPFWTMDGLYNFYLARKRNKSERKNEEKQAKADQQKKVASQQEKMLRLQQIREQQQIQADAANETNALEDDQDLYDRAA